MSEHTKGPWVVSTQPNRAGAWNNINAPDQSWPESAIGLVDCNNLDHPGNAALISAAPDLYEALRSLLAVVNVHLDDPRTAVFDEARAALQKAEARP